MKSFLLALTLCLCGSLLPAQVSDATLLFNWTDNSITPTSWLNGRYNDCWGVQVNGREIAIIGSTEGVHFFDVTDGEAATELTDAFVPGTADGPSLLHRDYHSYQNYLYTVADEGASTLQIIDLADLPTSTSVVYNESALIRRAHNIFIDTTSAHLYACGVSVGNVNHSLRILSLQNPEQPEVIASFPDFNLSLPYVHDVYVRNDTAYLNCGTSGFYVVDFTDPLNPDLLGTMTAYEQQGYNHSGWLHPNGQYYYMADETHGTDLKVVDVSDFSDIHVVTTFNAASGHADEIAHNLIVHEDKLYVSYYYDGLQVYDLSNPANPQRIAAYDTYENPNDGSYKGAWGVFPFFTSGRVILSDMHNGLFLFEKIEFTPVSATEVIPTESLLLYPNPASTAVTVQLESQLPTQSIQWTILDASGRQTGASGAFDIQKGQQQYELNINSLPAGSYLLRLTGEQIRAVAPLIILR